MTIYSDENRIHGEPGIDAIVQIAEQLSGDVRDGYSRIGDATAGAVRFKWTARLQDDGRFVVHETVGSGSVPVSSKPLSKDEVRPYIDERERRIQAKVDEFKRELVALQEMMRAPPKSSGELHHVESVGDPLQVYDNIRRMLKEGK